MPSGSWIPACATASTSGKSVSRSTLITSGPHVTRSAYGGHISTTSIRRASWTAGHKGNAISTGFDG